MRRAYRIIGWTLGAIGLAIGLVGVAGYLFITSDYVRAQLENHADAALGRKTRIGRISIDWGWTSHVRLDDVAISNTDWGKADHLFKADRIEFDIRLRPLLHGDLVLPTLTFQKPDVSLERSPEDRSNWSPEESPVARGAVEQLAPKERHEMPLIGRLEINDGHVGYRDIKRKLDLDGTVQTATGQASADPQAELSLTGKLEDQPLTLHFIGGSALMLRETDKPYPVDLNVSYGTTKLSLKGTLQDPLQYTGANVQLSLSGQDLADIFPLLGIPGPPTPPYRIVGQLHHEPGVWRLVDMTWHAGDSDLAGDVAVDQRPKPSHLTAHLVSQNLSFVDLAPLVGATPGKTGNVSAQQKRTAEQMEAKDELFPDVPLKMERLRAMDMDVTLDAKRVVAPSYLPVDTLYTRVVVRDGVARAQPLVVGLGGGKLEGQLAVDARTDDPKTDVNVNFQDVDLGAFFRGSRYFDTTKGKLRGRVLLAGEGHSLARVMGSATGNVAVAMTGGTVSSLMVSLAGLQIADALALYILGDDQIPIRCAVGRLNMNHGLVAFDRTVVDTHKSVLHVDGQAQLKTQQVDSRITADIKHFDLLDLHAPVVIKGKIRSPDISIGGRFPIPTPDFGGADDVNCDGLIRQLMAAD